MSSITRLRNRKRSLKVVSIIINLAIFMLLFNVSYSYPYCDNIANSTINSVFTNWNISFDCYDASEINLIYGFGDNWDNNLGTCTGVVDYDYIGFDVSDGRYNTVIDSGNFTGLNQKCVIYAISSSSYILAGNTTFNEDLEGYYNVSDCDDGEVTIDWNDTCDSDNGCAFATFFDSDGENCYISGNTNHSLDEDDLSWFGKIDFTLTSNDSLNEVNLRVIGRSNITGYDLINAKIVSETYGDGELHTVMLESLNEWNTENEDIITWKIYFEKTQIGQQINLSIANISVWYEAGNQTDPISAIFPNIDPDPSEITFPSGDNYEFNFAPCFVFDTIDPDYHSGLSDVLTSFYLWNIIDPSINYSSGFITNTSIWCPDIFLPSGNYNMTWISWDQIDENEYYNHDGINSGGNDSYSLNGSYSFSVNTGLSNTGIIIWHELSPYNMSCRTSVPVSDFVSGDNESYVYFGDRFCSPNAKIYAKLTLYNPLREYCFYDTLENGVANLSLTDGVYELYFTDYLIDFDPYFEYSPTGYQSYNCPLLDSNTFLPTAYHGSFHIKLGYINVDSTQNKTHNIFVNFSDLDSYKTITHYNPIFDLQFIEWESIYSLIGFGIVLLSGLIAFMITNNSIVFLVFSGFMYFVKISIGNDLLFAGGSLMLIIIVVGAWFEWKK